MFRTSLFGFWIESKPIVWDSSCSFTDNFDKLALNHQTCKITHELRVEKLILTSNHYIKHLSNVKRIDNTGEMIKFE